MLSRDLKRRSKKFVGLSLSLCLFLYFGLHLIFGNHGLLAWHTLDQKLRHVQMEHRNLASSENSLENKVKQLRPESISADLLAERAKDVLGYCDPDEIVVLNSKK